MKNSLREAFGESGALSPVSFKGRPTCAFIDLSALRHNYATIGKRLEPGTKVMAVVKANAYGHGDTVVSGALEGLGCECFGVAIVEEAARLRSSGIKSQIVVLGGVYRDQIGEFFELDLIPVVFDIETARLIDIYAGKAGAKKKVHVKIDTGMGRLGILPEEVSSFFGALKGLRNIEVEAVLSHFAESEAEEGAYSRGQLQLFRSCVETIRAMGFSPAFLEMANSAASVTLPDARFNLVRPGIMLYGAYPARRLEGEITLRPVLSLKTRVILTKRLKTGQSVSYGRRFVARRDSTIAVLPLGYADGLPRSLSGKGEFLIRGRRAPVAGTVCMDLVMCDVTGVPGVSAGDEAVVIGHQGGERISVEEAAERAGTISYEILCGISQRVPRVYI